MPCEICLEPLVLDLSALTCGHVFHSECVAGMLGSGLKSCPKCRKTVTKPLKLVFELETPPPLQQPTTSQIQPAPVNTDETQAAAATTTTTTAALPLASASDTLEQLQFHIGNLESRLEFLQDENAALKRQSQADALAIKDLNEAQRDLRLLLGALQDDNDRLKRQIHQDQQRANYEKQRLTLELVSLKSQLEAERTENRDLRNLKVAASTLNICKGLERLDESEICSFGVDELRRRLLATTIKAQEELERAEGLEAQLKRSQIRIERAEKALAHRITSSSTEPRQQETATNSKSERITATLTCPPLSSASSGAPVRARISNFMVPKGIKKAKSSSGAVINAFGGQSKIVKFPDGKQHFR